MVMETGPSVRARLSSAEAAGAEATEEAVEEAAVLPPQADSRPAAPTAPVASRKLRREIAMLIFVLLLKCKNIICERGFCTHPVVYNYDSKSPRKKKDANCRFAGQKRTNIALVFERELTPLLK